MLRIAALYDERYVTYVEAGRSEVRVKLFCLDPSHLLGQAIKGYRSAIYFSATLTPLAYYRDMLGANEEDYTLQVPSPSIRSSGMYVCCRSPSVIGIVSVPKGRLRICWLHWL